MVDVDAVVVAAFIGTGFFYLNCLLFVALTLIAVLVLLMLFLSSN